MISRFVSISHNIIQTRLVDSLHHAHCFAAGRATQITGQPQFNTKPWTIQMVTTILIYCTRTYQSNPTLTDEQVVFF